MDNLLLDVQDLHTEFKTPDGVVHAVNGVSFQLFEGETLGVVGESGSGKSVTMLSVLRLIASPPGKVTHGRALFLGMDLLQAADSQIRQIRGGQIGMIFQDPMTSLNPVWTVGRQLQEPLMLHLGLTRKQAHDRAVELLDMVGIPNPIDRLNDYPHQYSGGMRQRVMIAMALSCNPQILISDEPTTALDVTIQAQIMDLIHRLRSELGMSIIWITHDLGVVAGLAKRVLVMYGGNIVEEAEVKDLFKNPSHPYTVGLLGSLPGLNGSKRGKLTSIPGQPPVLLQKPQSCPFAPRCAHVIEKCRNEKPVLALSDDSHRVACWVDLKTGRPRQ